MAASLPFRIVSLNVWGLWIVAKQRKERIQAIGDWLTSTSRPNSISSDAGLANKDPSASYDVVCLQELWVRSDAEYLRHRAKESGLQYSRYFSSGALGSGLMILSRRPILSSTILAFPLNGNPLHFIQGDWFVGKAASSIVIDLGAGVGKAEIFCTHFYSPGDSYHEDEHWRRAHRLSQAWEMSKLVNSAAEKGRHVFVCGDLNSTPQSLILQLLTSYGQLIDSWTVTNPVPEFASRSPEESIKLNGITCDSPINSYSAGKHLTALALRDYGKRLDYILFRPGNASRTETPISIQCQTTSVELTSYIPGHPCSYSDHFAIEATFSLTPTPSSSSTSASSEPQYPTSLTSTQLESVILALSRHSQSVDQESALLLRIFGACVLTGFFVVPIAASFQPLTWLNWIFALAGTVVGATGATALYTGFIGSKWEKGALRNALEEMELELTNMQGR